MNCTFHHVGRQTYRCSRCGREVHNVRVLPLRARCHATPEPLPSPQRSKPSLPRRAFNFALALAKHVAGGAKQRTREEIDGLLTICRECEYHDGEICTHRKCGCKANGGEGYWNKLRWRSESCPDDRW